MTSSTKGRVITLTVTSDLVWYVCQSDYIISILAYSYICSPWCYIATLELRKAIARAYTAQLPLRFHIEYKPLELRAILSDMNDQAWEDFQGR
jgi:predicted DsbA family dithiol-disulfide isomerase